MKLLIILVFFSGLYADTLMKNRTIIEKGESDYIETSKNQFNKISLGYQDRFNYNKMYLDLDLELFKLSTDTGKMKNISLEYENKTDLQINSLLFSYNETEYGFYFGVIPFRGSIFSEMKDHNRNGGNGIELLIDQVFIGGFGRYTYNEIDFIIGEAMWDQRINYNSLDADNNDKSKGIFSIIKTQRGKHHLEINYFHVGIILNSNEAPIDYGNLDILGVGYLYDDSLTSGFVFSLELGASKTEEDNAAVAKNKIPGAPLSFAESLGFIVEKRNNKGYAYKTNLKYEDSIGNKDYFIGLEYFKTYNGWVSMNHGTLFLSNNSWWQLREGHQISLYGAYSITRDISMSAKYSRAVSSKVPDYFSISSSESLEKSNSKDNFFMKTDRIELELSIRF